MSAVFNVRYDPDFKRQIMHQPFLVIYNTFVQVTFVSRAYQKQGNFHGMINYGIIVVQIIQSNAIFTHYNHKKRIMKKFLFPFIPFLMLVILSNEGYCQIPARIESGIKSGNAKMIATFFNDNVELVILDKENVCSKEQAEVILDDFFSKNKPVDFKITRQGGTDSMYGIGKMQTAGTNFRIYFMLKSFANKPLIVQLRIEKEQ
jgi:hypothetical protein